jgi:hypothetical protein
VRSPSATWTEEKTGDRRKLAMTALVRQRTTVSNVWLADKLHLGHMSRVSQASRNAEAVKLAAKLASEGALLSGPQVIDFMNFGNTRNVRFISYEPW